MEIAHHLCLVSDQVIPNLTPALDPHFRPQRVTLLVSPEMRQQALWIEEALQAAAIHVQMWPVRDAWDLEHLHSRVFEFVAAHDGERLGLNVTGGTKPMSIAAHEVFRTLERPIFYVHPERDEVIWLFPSNRPSVTLADRIRLPAFLRVHGAQMARQGNKSGVAEHLRRLTSEMVQDVDRLAKPLATLNWLAHHAENDLISPRLDRGHANWLELRELVGRFEDHGLLRQVDDHLVFPHEGARFYVNGGWLEEHVFSEIATLHKALPAIQDFGRNIVVARRTGVVEVKNELDVAFLAENRFFLVECKTRRFGRRPDDHGPGSQALYKLDTLRDLLGGLQGRAMLASYQPLPTWVRYRAEDLGIRTCVGSELNRLKETLRSWIGGRAAVSVPTT